MGWFRKIFQPTTNQTIEEAVVEVATKTIRKEFGPGGILERAFCEAMRETALKNKRVSGDLKDTAFVWQMAFYLMRKDQQLNALRARDEALAALREFLRDERIRYGDARYGWDQSAAEALAEETITDHWESVSA